ncbi:MAG: hypothetical protein ACRDWS_15035 [Acidimicrobiia bacterium]
MRTDREIGRIERTSVARRPWSPAQYVAGLIGLFMTVLGGVAIARLLPTESLTGETVTVIGMGFTIVMAAVTLLVGLVFLAGAGRPYEARPGMISLGVALLAFGIIIFIEPNALGGALGVNETSGLVYAGVGLVAAIAGIASPTLVSRRAVEERLVEEEDGAIHVT